MRLIHYISVIFLVYIDQITKYYAARIVHGIHVNKYIDVVFVKNYGITLGFFNRPDEFVVSVLIAVMTILVTIYLCVIAKRNASVYMWIIAGAIGNLIDRIRLGYVIDFLDFHVNGSHWPAFNVADACICAGVILLLFFGKERKYKNES